MKSLWALSGLFQQAKDVIHDITGIRIETNDVILQRQFEVPVPKVPEMYYLQAVTERNMYGTMTIIQ